MMNTFVGGPVLALMIWEQLSKLLQSWLLWLSGRMLFFSFCQLAHDLEKVSRKIEWGDQVYRNDACKASRSWDDLKLWAYFCPIKPNIGKLVNNTKTPVQPKKEDNSKLIVGIIVGIGSLIIVILIMLVFGYKIKVYYMYRNPKFLDFCGSYSRAGLIYLSLGLINETLSLIIS